MVGLMVGGASGAIETSCIFLAATWPRVLRLPFCEQNGDGTLQAHAARGFDQYRIAAAQFALEPCAGFVCIAQKQRRCPQPRGLLGNALGF